LPTCAEVIGLSNKNEEVFCKQEATNSVITPEGPYLLCDRHFKQFRTNVEKNFNNVTQWAKDGVGW
jgi:hypothetical protein